MIRCWLVFWPQLIERNTTDTVFLTSSYLSCPCQWWCAASPRHSRCCICWSEGDRRAAALCSVSPQSCLRCWLYPPRPASHPLQACCSCTKSTISSKPTNITLKNMIIWCWLKPSLLRLGDVQTWHLAPPCPLLTQQSSEQQWWPSGRRWWHLHRHVSLSSASWPASPTCPGRPRSPQRYVGHHRPELGSLGSRRWARKNVDYTK